MQESLFRFSTELQWQINSCAISVQFMLNGATIHAQLKSVFCGLVNRLIFILLRIAPQSVSFFAY